MVFTDYIYGQSVTNFFIYGVCSSSTNNTTSFSDVNRSGVAETDACMLLSVVVLRMRGIMKSQLLCYTSSRGVTQMMITGRRSLMFVVVHRGLRQAGLMHFVNCGSHQMAPPRWRS